MLNSQRLKKKAKGESTGKHAQMKVLIKNHQRQIRISLRRLQRDSLHLLRAFNTQKAELGILLVNDRGMKKLNHLHRGIDRTTDVLSFPIFNDIKEIPGDRETLLGDVVINLHAAERQSALYNHALSSEVRRLLIHGFLHLLGYDHERSLYQEKKMRKMEKELQDALAAMD